MQSVGLEIGRIVTSTAGRDEGQAFVVVGRLDRKHVLVSDGNRRPLERPKKKNVRHLKVHQARAADLSNQDIRLILDKYQRRAQGEHKVVEEVGEPDAKARCD